MKQITAYEAMEKLLTFSDVKTILDVGSGAGHHAAIMRGAGRNVVTNSLEAPADIIGDFADIPETDQFDSIWAAHVLEHQPNPNNFLKKCFRLLRDDGVLAVTVPPLKHNIVGGHVALFNPGLLLYHAILAGFDCREASVKQYGYNISLIVRKRAASLPELRMDQGDIETLAPFFPMAVWQGFDGQIQRINWP